MNSLHTFLSEALEHRLALVRAGYPIRIFDGAGDGLDGLFIDLFDDVLLAHIHAGSSASLRSESTIVEAISEIANRLSCKAAFLWLRSEQIGKTLKDGFRTLLGSADFFIVSDGPLQFYLKPGVTPSGGLFVDTREIRGELVKAKFKRVINLFCFTGTLGIAAALGGAEEVIQVDISKSALNWAQENWQLNRGSLSTNMRFIPEDSRKFMAKELRRIERGGSKADLVLIDPPVFGTSEGTPFVLEHEIETLLLGGLSLLNSGGRMIFTCNLSSMSWEDIRELVYIVSEEIGASVRSITRVSPPQVDFGSPARLSHALRGVCVDLD